MYKILNNVACTKFKSHPLSQTRNCPIAYNLQNSARDIHLVLPKPETELKKMSFSYNNAFFGITLKSQNLDFFKKRLIRH